MLQIHLLPSLPPQERYGIFKFGHDSTQVTEPLEWIYGMFVEKHCFTPFCPHHPDTPICIPHCAAPLPVLPALCPPAPLLHPGMDPQWRTTVSLPVKEQYYKQRECNSSKSTWLGRGCKELRRVPWAIKPWKGCPSIAVPLLGHWEVLLCSSYASTVPPAFFWLWSLMDTPVASCFYIWQ